MSRELSRHFSGDERLSVTSRALPFGGRRAVVLNWPSWQVSLAYEEGGLVAEDSAEITRRLGAAVPCGLSGIRNRIRAVFGDDDGREYTNEAVQVLHFLLARLPVPTPAGPGERGAGSRPQQPRKAETLPPAPSWPRLLRAVRSWLTRPSRSRAGGTRGPEPPPAELQHLIDNVTAGHGLRLYLPP